MDRASRISVSIVCFVLTFVILSAVGGFAYVINKASEYFSSEILEQILTKTSEEEGFCLTDCVKEANLEYDGMPYVYQDACVSIYSIPDVGSNLLGSGVCIASKGYEYSEGQFIEQGSYIITNCHVIENVLDCFTYEIRVFPNEYDNYDRYGVEQLYYDGQLLWWDAYLDMALIYVEYNIDWVKVKDRSIKCDDSEKIKRGESAFVIGTPLKISNQNTITKGTIYSEDEYYTYTTTEEKDLSNVYEYLIPIRIPINNGNSGGGLFDADGYLVGQPTLGVAGSTAYNAVNYAIPIYPAMIVMDRIIKANEEDESFKIYGLSDLNFDFVDSLESNVVSEGDFPRWGGRIYFYGNRYSPRDLKFDEDGLKVLRSARFGIKKDDIITIVKINEEEFDIKCRNDLIFVLLQCEKGDTLSIKIDEEFVDLSCA